VRYPLALLLLLGGCSPQIAQLRPYAAHPTQQMSGEDAIVDVQGGVRTTTACMRAPDLDDWFRLPGKGVKETGNPFLCRPPRAPVKFTVFRLDIRNDTEYDVFVDTARITLRDAEGNEYHPLDEKALTNYWIGKVTIELGKPMTWTAQMSAISRKDVKEKSRTETLYAGGPIPSRGEHAGFVAFRGLRETKERLYPIGYDLVGLAAGAPLGAVFAEQVARRHDALVVGAGALAGALLGRLGMSLIAPRRDPQLDRLQLLIEVVTRSSRYGNPLNVALMEFNFARARVSKPPKDQPETDQWRNK